ncbi:MAG: EpsG family protein [Tannerellaceae bacterium]|nr:EpsG family protein [Tannerellaceae bacterium]
MVYIPSVLVALLLPSILAGCRDLTVGGDTLGYMEPTFRIALSCDSFATLCDRSRLEPLYLLLSYGIAQCTDDVAWFLFFQHLIIILIVYLSVYRWRNRVPTYFCMLIFFCLSYCWALNIVRQMLALSFCLLSFSYLLKYQMLRSLFVFLPALGFHATSFIYLIIYPIFYIVNNKNTRIIRIGEIVGLSVFFLIILNIENLLTLLISIDLLPEHFMIYSLSTGLEATDFPSGRFFYCLFMFALLWYIRRKNYNKDMFILFECLILSCLALCFLSLFIGATVSRCVWYFLFLSIIFLPMMLYNKRKRCISYNLNYVCVIFLLFYWFGSVVLNKFTAALPYTSELLDIN